MRTIAFYSLKGVCGKTTSCVNLAAALAEMGRRVLVVDLDANARASRTFSKVVGFDDSVGAALLAHKPLKAVIQPTDVAGVWLAPASAELRVIAQRRDIADPERVGEDGFRPRTLAPRSDPDGRFRVEGLEFGTIYGLLVRAEGWGAREVPWWTASEEGHEVLVRLERQASLEFEVRDSFGVPAGLALVVLEAQREVKGNDPWAWRQQHTDERGIVLLEQLDPGPYHVRVTRGELHAEADLTVTGGSAMHERLDLHAP